MAASLMRRMAGEYAWHNTIENEQVFGRIDSSYAATTLVLFYLDASNLI